MAAKRRRARGVDPKSFEVLRLMREGLSLTRAAQKAKTTPKTVRTQVGSVIRRTKQGRYVAAPSDRLTRTISFLTRDGQALIKVRGSRAASRVAAHKEAVRRFAQNGDTELIREWEGETIRSGRTVHRFLTDPDVLERLGNAGQLQDDRLYRKGT